MKTDDILNLDCAKQENKNKLNSFLCKVKPVAKLMGKNNITKGEVIPTEVLEKALNGICSHYGYRTQGICSYFEDDTFKFYKVSVLDKNRQWKGNAYGLTLWETEAKTIIKIYTLIKKGEQEHEQ